MFKKVMSLFSKKKKQNNAESFHDDPYAYMGKLGVSPAHMLMYTDAMEKINEHNQKINDKVNNRIIELEEVENSKKRKE